MANPQAYAVYLRGVSYMRRWDKPAATWTRRLRLSARRPGSNGDSLALS
jgi:hypothetical protein